jgi:acetoin utilization protein AcuB
MDSFDGLSASRRGRESAPEEGRIMRVRELMTKRPITIDPEAPVATAVATMRERSIRHLPVVDADGALIGMVSDRDVRDAVLGPVFAEYLSLSARRRLRGLSQALEDLRVRDVMTWGAVTVTSGAPVEQAAAMMFEARISALPVVESGRLVGIVTERDVLRELTAKMPAVKEHGLW